MKGQGARDRQGPRASPRSKASAGLLLYCRKDGRPLVFLVHPGGPYWANKDSGSWSIPKGEIEGDEEPLVTALREFREETGIEPQGPFLALGSVTQKAGKVVHAWAFEGPYLSDRPIRSNTFTIEWPPGSGTLREFPEIDRAAFFDAETAKIKINPAQVAFIERLESLLSDGPADIP